MPLLGAFGGARRFRGLGEAHADQPPSERPEAGSAFSSWRPPFAGDKSARVCIFLRRFFFNTFIFSFCLVTEFRPW